MHTRKTFSYKIATTEQILAHFLTSSRQAISIARKTWRDDEEVSSRIEQAYRLYKISMLDEKLSVRK